MTRKYHREKLKYDERTARSEIRESERDREGGDEAGPSPLYSEAGNATLAVDVCPYHGYPIINPFRV